MSTQARRVLICVRLQAEVEKLDNYENIETWMFADAVRRVLRQEEHNSRADHRDKESRSSSSCSRNSEQSRYEE